LEEEALTEDEEDGVVGAAPLEEDGGVGAAPLEDEDEEYEYEDWVDADGTKYYLIKAKNNVLLDYTEQTIVGRLVDGVKVDADEDEE
jgi:hypothetical protein